MWTRIGLFVYRLDSHANGSQIDCDVPLGSSGTHVLLPVCPGWGDEFDHFDRAHPSRHDDEASNNRKRESLREADFLATKYCYSPVHINDSNLCAICTVGVHFSASTRIVWRRAKVNINRLLGNSSQETYTAHGPVSPLPYEIVEMIIVHIAHDLDTLKAFSLTCCSWYIAAVPHLHHTLTLRDTRNTIRDKLKPLSQLHRLGLMPLIKEIRVEQNLFWFMPQEVSPCDLRYFSAFENVHTLSVKYLDISRFIPGIERFFGHFLPTLRSVAFFGPFCTPGQLPHFLSLFSNLEDIKIQQCYTYALNVTIPDAELVPFSAPRLQGRLVVYNFDLVEVWTRLIAVGGGLRFNYMELCRVGECASVLFEACAETLETLRVYGVGTSHGEYFSIALSTDLS
jgi:hypothetical protein